MYTKTHPDLMAGEAVIRDNDGAHIPADPLNTDWRAYQGWVAAGNTPSPAAGSTRADLDAIIRAACAEAVANAFSVGGMSMRGSMNLWLGSIVAAQIANNAPSVDPDDKTCLAMAPHMNAWESAMFVERDRLISLALTLADAKWPALPDGAAAYVLSCDQG